MAPYPVSIRLGAALALAALLACGGGGGGGGGRPPDVTPPTMPGVVAASLGGPTSVALSWGAATDDTGVAAYRVYRDGVLLATVPGLSTTDAGLASVTTYCYAVSARDGAGNESPQTSPACVTTGDGYGPSTPPDLVASVTRPGAVDLAWSASTDDVGVTGYRVYREGTLVAEVPGTSTSDTPAAPATRTCYTVSAMDAAGNESPPSAEACATTLWSVATVACVPTGYTVGGPDVALDSAGKVHVGYHGFNAALYYATNASGAWEWTLVKQGTTEAVTSVHVALDSHDKVHLSYYSFADFTTQTKDLGYATNAGGAWTQQPVDTLGDVGTPSSIAIGPGDAVHVSYFDATNAWVKYAHGTFDAWTIGSVDTGGAPRNVVRVAPSGDVHLLYTSNVYFGPLRHALVSGGTTTITSIPSSDSLGGALLALDASGAPWVAWRSGTAMAYATLAGGVWTGGSTGIDAICDALVVDASGSLHFYAGGGYFPPGGPAGLALFHTTNASGAWVQTLSVIELDPGATQVALAVGATGQVHAVYVDGTGTCLRYATDR